MDARKQGNTVIVIIEAVILTLIFTLMQAPAAADHGEISAAAAPRLMIEIPATLSEMPGSNERQEPGPLAGFGWLAWIGVVLPALLLGLVLQRLRRDLAGNTDQDSGGERWWQGPGALRRRVDGLLREMESERSQLRQQLQASQTLVNNVRENEVWFASILNVAVDGFLTCDRKGCIEFVSATAATLFGYLPGALEGQPLARLLVRSGGQQSLPDEAFNGSLREVRARLAEEGLCGLRADGTPLQVKFELREIEVQGRLHRVVLIQRQSLDERAVVPAPLEQALANCLYQEYPDALVAVDADGRIVEYNQVAADTFGYQRDQALGQDLAELIIPAEFRDAHYRGMKRYLQTGERRLLGGRIEVQALHADGHWFPVELTVLPLASAGQRYFVARLRDISQRKEDERALRQNWQRAEAMATAQNHLLAHLSHEIRTPLNAVLGAIGMLRDSDLDRTQQLYAETAQSSAQLLSGLLNNILDFSRLQSGDLALACVDVDLSELVTGCVRNLGDSAREKGLMSAVQIAPDLPRRVRGDAGRLRQVINQFLSSAIAHTETGSVLLSLQPAAADCRQPGSSRQLRFCVTDTGAKLADEIRSMLQQPGGAHLPVEDIAGRSGLELAVCLGLVRLMGGEAGCECEGQENRVWFEVPLQPLTDDGGEPGDGADGETFAAATEILPRGVVVSVDRLLAEFVAWVGENSGCPVDRLVLARLRGDELLEAADFDSAVVAWVDGRLSDRQLDRVAQLARASGVQRLLLLVPDTTPALMQRAVQGQYDEVLVAPLLAARLQQTLLAPSLPAAPTPDAHAPTAVPGARILLAEDNAANQMVASTLLRRAGYSVDIATNGYQVLDCLREQDYHAVLMDVRMPGMDGLETTRRIRRMPGSEALPIIALTANVLAQDVERCFSAGMNAFVPKPIDRRYLREVLRKHVAPGAQPVKVMVDDPGATPEDDVEEQPTGGSGGRTRMAPLPLDDYHQELLLDGDALERLRSDVSTEAFPQLLRLYLEEILAAAESLGQGVAGEALENLAHTIKSSAAAIGACRLQRCAQQLELAARAELDARVESLVPELETLLRATALAYRGRFAFLETALNVE